MTVAVSLDAPAFSAQTACWVCGGTALRRFHQSRLDFREYARQDPALAEYSGRRVWIVECRSCGFGQPEELPRLPRFFERMYDQRWADDWVEREFEARYKDLIFRTILRQLDRRVAQEAGAVFVPFQTMFDRAAKIAPAEHWAGDGVHPTTHGAALMAHWWLKAVGA